MCALLYIPWQELMQASFLFESHIENEINAKRLQIEEKNLCEGWKGLFHFSFLFYIFIFAAPLHLENRHRLPCASHDEHCVAHN